MKVVEIAYCYWHFDFEINDPAGQVTVKKLRQQ